MSEYRLSLKGTTKCNVRETKKAIIDTRVKTKGKLATTSRNEEFRGSDFPKTSNGGGESRGM